jgi:RNA polymerase sigma-70 factor (ECF subfamily)
MNMTLPGSAAEACFRARYPALVRFLHGMVHDRARAEDVAQEAFRRLLVRGPTTRPDADRWVFRVARRLALDELKLDRHRQEREAAWERLDDAAVFDPDDLAQVRRLVAALPDRAREVLLLREVSDLPYDEIAAVVGRTVNAVKQDLHRARAALRRAWMAQEERE